jgi:hypothetical protein
MPSRSALCITARTAVFAAIRPRGGVLFDYRLSISPHRRLDIGPIATLRNRPGFVSAVLAGPALIALVAFVAAIPPQQQRQEQLHNASTLGPTTEPATIRAASGADTAHAATARTVAAVRTSDVATGQPANFPVNAQTDAALLVPQQFGIRTLADRLEGRGGGQAVDVHDDDTDQQDDDWAQQQEEEQDEEEQQEQDQQNEEQAQEARQEAEQQIQESEQEAEEQNEQAQQQALEDEQQAQMDEQQAGQ